MPSASARPGRTTLVLIVAAWLAGGAGRTSPPAHAAPPAVDPRAASRVLVSVEDGRPVSRAVGAGDTVVVAGRPDTGAGTVATRRADDDEMRVLVELQGAPLARLGAANARAAAGTRAAQRQRVGDAIVRAVERMRGRRLARHDVVTREYAQVFHGLAVRLPAAAVAEVRRLPDVAGVHPDVERHTTLAESVALVGAPAFWTAHGYRGAGTVIAIIDSGVDYAHPDLGSCFGPGCKVAGGFDFVNTDADPRDDNGHGTHVASIAAGDGTFDGVAPGATLLAYKVCDAQGVCFDSNVIAGIERAVDPNGDGNPSDHVRVMNLSLGGPGDADGPLAQAVDAATAAGVLGVVAAGNSGPGFGTVQSPGAARTALTVGATDDADALADFSSRGPTPVAYEIKPEIVAPGVAICAARAAGTTLGPPCAGGTHVQLQGTSMATPHVAGAAALLRGAFPALSPAEAKALLVENSLDVGLGVMEQGAGRLDVAAAGAAKTAVTPAAVSLGLDDPALAVWTTSATVTVRNLDPSSPRAYAMSLTPFAPGVAATVTPSAFVLAPGEARDVVLDFVVNNGAVPEVPAPYTHEATLLVDSGSGPDAQRQRVPVAFVKQSRLRVHLDPDLFAFVAVHDGTTLLRGEFLPPFATTYETLLGAGTYDVVVKYEEPAAVVVREGAVVAGSTEVTLPRAEAVHTVAFELRDEHDQPMVADGLVLSMSHHGASSIIYAGGPRASWAFSATSAAYDVDIAAYAHRGPATYFATGVVRGGVAADHLLGNRGPDLARGHPRYVAPPGEPPSLALSFLLFMDATQSFGFGAGDAAPLPDDLWVSTTQPAGGKLFLWPAMIDTGYPAVFDIFRFGPLLHGGSAAGTIEAYGLFMPTLATYATRTGELPFNLGPPFWFERLHVDSPSSVLLAPPADTHCQAFHHQGGDGPEHPNNRVDWELRSGGVPLLSGTLPQTEGGCNLAGTQQIQGLAPGAYDFVVPTGPPYFVGGLAGATRLEASFDTTRPDPTPPFVSRLEIRSGGRLTDAVGAGAVSAVSLEVEDAGGVAGVQVEWQNGGRSGVVPAAPADGLRWEAAVPPCTLGWVSLGIVATDASGNAIRQWLDPGYRCVLPTCGNGVVEDGESCDDGNTADGDGCDATCGPTGCGDGIVSGGEQCDDGNDTEADGCSSTCRLVHDAVVRAPRPLVHTIAAGVAEIRRSLSVQVANGDVSSRSTRHRDPIRLVASDGTCPPGTVAGPPVFAATLTDTVTVSTGRSATARIPLRISRDAFTSREPGAPQRCSLSLHAETAIAGNVDPTPANDVVLVDLDVVDLNDTAAAPEHQSLLESLAPRRVKIARGRVSARLTVPFRVRNGDPFDVFGHTVAVVADDGDCPPGTAGVLDLDVGTIGGQPAVVVPSEATRPGTLALTLTAAGFASPTRASPGRCSLLLIATGPGGDVEASNDTARIVIDVFDENDPR